MGIREWVISKLNPAQERIARDYGEEIVTDASTRSNLMAYEELEVVNRGVNIIVDSCSEILVDVGDKVPAISRVKTDVRAKKVNKLINFQPNPYQDASSFKRQVYLDLLLEGNAFIHWDGGFLWRLPAQNVEVKVDKKTYISEIIYNDISFKPDEIIYIFDNSTNPFRGASRLESASKSISTLSSMTTFHLNFFKHGTIPGLILQTPNTLSPRVKERILLEWAQKYNPKSGGRRPIILDGDMKLDTLGTKDLRELDFVESIKAHESKILKALGVPPILLESGNNANIAPNNKLFYTSTVLPLTVKVLSAFETYFGYDLKPVTQNILALRPELRDEANWLSTLVNAGIMTRNEAREKLRMEQSDDEIADDLILPANVAGSAVDSTVGGNPGNGNED